MVRAPVLLYGIIHVAALAINPIKGRGGAAGPSPALYRVNRECGHMDKSLHSGRGGGQKDRDSLSGMAFPR